MSFGWSVGDILKIVEICNEIRRFCKHAPAELQDLSDRLERIGTKLSRLSDTLKKSGLGVWSGTPAVEEHLAEVETFLKPLIKAVHHDRPSLVKIQGFFRLAQQQSELKRIQKLLDIDEDAIKEVRIDLILVCSLENLRFMTDAREASLSTAVASSSRATDVGSNSVLPPLICPPRTRQPLLAGGPTTHSPDLASETTRAFETAVALSSRARQTVGPALAATRRIEGSLPLGQNCNDFVTEIVSLAEAAELYSQHVDPASKLDQFTNITRKAPHLARVATLTDNDTRPILSPFPPLPVVGSESLNLEHEIYGYLSSASDNASLRRWAGDKGRDRPQTNDFLGAAVSRQSHATSTSNDTISNSSWSQAYSGVGSDIIHNNSTADEILPLNDTIPKGEVVELRKRAHVRFSELPAASNRCSFEIKESENSVLLRIITFSKSSSTSNAIHASRALLPPLDSSPSGSRSINSSGPNRHSRIFQHCFQIQHRPIPHLLHPSVEGPDREPHEPYKITFERPQYISEEGTSEDPHWTPSLTYVLFDESDRDRLCEKIFGKTLLSLAGSNEISLKNKRVSHLCAIALWQDPVTRSLSVTFNQNLGVTKPPAPRDVEYKVHGLWDTGKASKDTKRLVIAIAPMSTAEDAQQGFPELTRQTTAGTVFSRKSTASSHKLVVRRQSSSSDGDGRIACTIDFTHSAGRDSFLAHLERQRSVAVRG